MIHAETYSNHQVFTLVLQEANLTFPAEARLSLRGKPITNGQTDMPPQVFLLLHIAAGLSSIMWGLFTQIAAMILLQAWLGTCD